MLVSLFGNCIAILAFSENHKILKVYAAEIANYSMKALQGIKKSPVFGVFFLNPTLHFKIKLLLNNLVYGCM